MPRVGKETRPPPQLRTSLMRHLHNLPTRRLTDKAVFALPAAFTLNLEHFAAKRARTLRLHGSSLAIRCTGVGPRRERALRCRSPFSRSFKKFGVREFARLQRFGCRLLRGICANRTTQVDRRASKSTPIPPTHTGDAPTPPVSFDIQNPARLVAVGAVGGIGGS
jgi:hypothetical protein